MQLTVFESDWTVERELGRGGEGSVFSVVDDQHRPRLALKWYFAGYEWRRTLLEYIIERGPPTDRFLWPLALVAAGDGSFGYVMHLRPEGYASLAALLRGRVERREDRVLRFCNELASSFLALHAMGLCYRDINFGNAFYDPTGGQALICDNDNVGIDGVSRSGVRGAPQFMAPEIVREEALPSRSTDQHSLAVMLYYLLIVGHPLEGMRTWRVTADRDAHRRFFGDEPIFVFDPNDDRNRPDPIDHAHVQSRWDQLPPLLRELFTRAFTDGLRDPNARVQDSEWNDALLRARIVLWRCPSCSAVSFARREASCPRCHEPVAMFLHYLGLEHAVSDLLVVTKHPNESDFGVSKALGLAERHPTHQELLGLRNCTIRPWTVVDRRGVASEVAPGRRVALRPGTRIRIDDDWADVCEASGT